MGLLRSDYDGAQDHDYILRISEDDPAFGKIHHVARDALSLAQDAQLDRIRHLQQGLRGAGRRECAVGDHLKRMGRRSRRSHAINNLTIYSVDYRARGRAVGHHRDPVQGRDRDHAQLHRDAARDHRLPTTYEIVLVDNWSVTTVEAQ